MTFLSLHMLWNWSSAKSQTTFAWLPWLCHAHCNQTQRENVYTVLTLFGRPRTHPPWAKMVDFMMFTRYISQLHRGLKLVQWWILTCVCHWLNRGKVKAPKRLFRISWRKKERKKEIYFHDLLLQLYFFCRVIYLR